MSLGIYCAICANIKKFLVIFLRKIVHLSFVSFKVLKPFGFLWK